ncbi:MAG TPA: hypothetical protein VFT22_16460 [Kofleriaceae bacterium]|nr:hypothetical protein [Kofleriaceae bacterium]
MRQLLAAAALIALNLAACRDSPSQRPAPSGSGAAAGSSGSGGSGGSGASGGSAVDPWAAASAPSPPDTPEARKKRAEAALGRVSTIEPEVARLRALAFTRSVPTRYQSAAEFRTFVRDEIAKDLPGGRSRDVSLAFAHLGLLARPVDLATVEEQAMTTQAGAYYSPDAKAFFLVMVPDSALMLDTITAHELTHALQDQHFDLSKYLPSDRSLDDDAASARRFVVEGDATLVMLLYAMQGVVGGKLPPAAMTTLERQIEGFAELDVEALKAQSKAQSALFGAMDADIRKSIDAMDDIPPIILAPLLDAYMKGALVAWIAFQRGGWASVDALYRDPPESTEQVLHPRTKLIPVRDHPHRVTLARSAEPELTNNVLGELQWQVYFMLWRSPRAAEASEGWGGDRYSVTRRKDGRLIGRIATIWDSDADARQFADAYVATLAVRFPRADPGHPAAGIARPDGGRVFVRAEGRRVFIVDGADDAGALDALARTTTFR